MDKNLMEVIMDKTNRVIHGLRAYIEQHGHEREEVVNTINEMADQLESGEMSIIDTSLYIKNIKQSWNIAVYEIFSEVYREASK